MSKIHEDEVSGLLAQNLNLNFENKKFKLDG
jgi:hypothetical protein